jgi:hypothetical protein
MELPGSLNPAVSCSGRIVQPKRDGGDNLNLAEAIAIKSSFHPQSGSDVDSLNRTVRKKPVTSILPFPTILQGHRQLRFVDINPKTQVTEKQVLFPVVFQRVTFYHKSLKKEEHLRSESPLPHHPSSFLATRILR